jgi:predicted nucleotidyltransferase
MNIEVPRERIEEFCRKWHVTELALFGSVLRDDFRPDSDVDVLVTFEPEHQPSFGSRLEMEDELAAMSGRVVDVVQKRNVINPFIRDHIRRNHRVVYAAA